MGESEIKEEESLGFKSNIVQRGERGRWSRMWPSKPQRKGRMLTDLAVSH